MKCNKNEKEYGKRRIMMKENELKRKKESTQRKGQLETK